MNFTIKIQSVCVSLSTSSPCVSSSSPCVPLCKNSFACPLVPLPPPQPYRLVLPACRQNLEKKSYFLYDYESLSPLPWDSMHSTKPCQSALLELLCYEVSYLRSTIHVQWVNQISAFCDCQCMDIDCWPIWGHFRCFSSIPQTQQISNKVPTTSKPDLNKASVIFLDCIINGPPADHWLSNPPACVSLHAVQQKKESTSRLYHYLSPKCNIRPPRIEEITITVLNPHQSHHHHQCTTGGMVWPLLGPESCGEVSWVLRRREAQLYSNVVLLACYMYSSSSITVQYSEIVKQCRIFFLIESRVQSRAFL